MIPVALSIAGSDPSGGAGIQADLKTFHQFGVYGEAAITLLTVQNTSGVSAVEVMAADFVSAQIGAVLEDIPPHAIKTGALGSRAVVEAVAYSLGSAGCPLVVDPVMISKHGAPLMSGEAQQALVRMLLPLCTIITPNLPEAEAITNRAVTTLEEMRDAARAMVDLGARGVLMKGGHLEGAATDLLWIDGEWLELPATRVETKHTHGTGCTYSAAIAAGLAKGQTMTAAVRAAKDFIDAAIRTNPGLGGGSGPVNHFAPAR